MGDRILQGFFWKILERFGVSGIQFVIQILLARLLSPDDYGMLSYMIIFTTLANIFVQSGFNTALIQNREVQEEDYSSVFWISLGIAATLYIGLFFGAVYIGEFYNVPDIVGPFRVLALILFPGAFNSIQIAIVSREMNFKKVFISNVGGILISGIVGVILAFAGKGVWALVFQNLLNVLITCVVMRFTVKWHLYFKCDLKRVKRLFSFGWKLLLSNLIDAFYQDLSSLVIGKKYSTAMLGYYNRGKQFPQFIITAINNAVQSVMLPAMSRCQDERGQVKELTRKSIMLSAYIIFPTMAGLAAVAKPIVVLLLTDKWLSCVPFLQIFCFSFALWPVHTSNLQAINAMGRSDIFLKLEIIKKIMGVSVLFISIFYFSSPIAIALTNCFTGIISSFINAYPNKKLIDYSYKAQMADILPSFFISLVMFVSVSLMTNLKMNLLILLGMQIITGIILYWILSVTFRLRPYKMLYQIIIVWRRSDKK